MKPRLVLFLIFLIIMQACVMRKMAYNHADRFIVHKVDELLNLEPEQKSFVQLRIRHFHEWHRKEELPKVLSLLDELKELASDGLSEEEYDLLFAKLDERRILVVGQILPEISAFLADVNDNNRKAFVEKMRDLNKKTEKELKKSEKSQMDARKKSLTKTYGQWIGTVSPEQRRIIDHFVESTQAFQVERRSRTIALRRSFTSLVNEKKPREDLQKFLEDWVMSSDSGGEHSYSQKLLLNQSYAKKLILDMDKTLTEQQRAKFQQEVTKLSRDIQDLMSR